MAPWLHSPMRNAQGSSAPKDQYPGPRTLGLDPPTIQLLNSKLAEVNSARVQKGQSPIPFAEFARGVLRRLHLLPSSVEYGPLPFNTPLDPEQAPKRKGRKG